MFRFCVEKAPSTKGAWKRGRGGGGGLQQGGRATLGELKDPHQWHVGECCFCFFLPFGVFFIFLLFIYI